MNEQREMKLSTPTGSPLRVLVACEYSGTVRDCFTARGWEAWSCDLLPTERPGNHYQGDCREMLAEKWDLLIAHPTCTYLTNSGVSWLHRDASRWPKLFEGAAFFKELWQADVPHVAVENPIMHKYARQLIGGKQSQIVQPWMFGHTESKATGLWLRNLPNLLEENNVKAAMMELPDRERQRLHYLPPSENRWKERSRTYAGIAQAMANQWGTFLENN